MFRAQLSRPKSRVFSKKKIGASCFASRARLVAWKPRQRGDQPAEEQIGSRRNPEFSELLEDHLLAVGLPGTMLREL
jgi:hypothetical protein